MLRVLNWLAVKAGTSSLPRAEMTSEERALMMLVEMLETCGAVKTDHKPAPSGLIWDGVSN
jgi:hypothetical protein